MTNEADIGALKDMARHIREDILLQIYAGGSGHPGGSMSCVELLAALFGHVIKPSADWIRRNSRDHVILSKGHAAPALYAVLAETGLIPKEELKTLKQPEQKAERRVQTKATQVDPSAKAVPPPPPPEKVPPEDEKRQGKQPKPLAHLASELGRPERAAEMLGACAAVRGGEDPTSVVLTRLGSRLREELGPGEYARAYAAGTARSRAEARAFLDPATL